MGIVEQHEQLIREYVNRPWKRHFLKSEKAKWNKLCSSLDVIGDTQEAINFYFNLPEYSAKEGGYLYLYGILQAFFLQQDAVNHLTHVLLGKKIVWEQHYPELYRVRELRNDSTGHPTGRTNGSYHSIAQNSISKYGFMLRSDIPKSNSTEFREVDIQELKQVQETSVVLILSNAIDVMKKEFDDHKMKFKGKKLQDLVPESLDYSMSKLYQGVHSDYPLVNVDYAVISKFITEMKHQIGERYGSHTALEGLNDQISRIEYIHERLNDWMDSGQLRGNRDAEVFIDSLSDRLKELKSMLEEIDEEFE